ncbi:hypothetical protein OSH08_05445 [Kaistia geumhonensis]|uniref:Uncharacterized protein n=1 Tax=Kaistia geumhonensis TaxID=410839 RepID=A0ABU0M693_9HYPH|nr:hypothetical protein [Kaistia geumhonensis]MCX5478437.1 hypothetical protein [Kaistia geumhonensis]MDQ0516345.1 hypothetical protein [Kaistia geumhonensis]
MIRIAGALALAFVALAGVAHAAAVAEPSTVVTVPIGDWIAAGAAALAASAGSVVLWGLRQLPGALLQRLRTLQAEQILTMAMAYGLNAVAGAARGKVLSADVGNAVAAEALGYVVEHGPNRLIKWLGGEQAIREKIIARLDLGADAEVKAGEIVTAATGGLFAAGR